jgi:hypothetical protein
MPDTPTRQASCWHAYSRRSSQLLLMPSAPCAREMPGEMTEARPPARRRRRVVWLHARAPAVRGGRPFRHLVQRPQRLPTRGRRRPLPRIVALARLPRIFKSDGRAERARQGQPEKRARASAQHTTPTAHARPCASRADSRPHTGVRGAVTVTEHASSDLSAGSAAADRRGGGEVREGIDWAAWGCGRAHR